MIRYMPAAEYHALDALSSGVIRACLTPADAAAWRARSAEPRVATPAMEIGTMVHRLLLESHLPLTVAERETRAYASAAPIVEAMAGMSDITQLLTGAQCETSVTWQHGAVAGKARPDIVNGGILADVKTCADLSRFDRDIADRAYDVQLAWYAAGLSATGWVTCDYLLIAVETRPPYSVDVVEIGYDALTDAWELCKAGILHWQAVCDAAPTAACTLRKWRGRYVR